MATIPDPEALSGLWAELRRHLEGRFRELCEELRHYPTPIARCDDQLPKLIEQRDRARAELERMSAIEETGRSSAIASEAVQRFLAAAGASEDDAELALRARLQIAADAQSSLPGSRAA